MVNFKPTKLKTSISIISGIVFFFFVFMLTIPGLCCLAYLECPEGKVNTKVGALMGNSYCCQICASPAENAFIEILVNNIKIWPIIAFLLVYTIYSLVQKPKKK